MATSILSKMQKRSKVEAASVGITDRVYEAMMEDARDEIRAKAISDARIDVQGELSTAQAKTARAETETAKAQADVSKAQAETTKAQASITSLTATIASLKETEKSLQAKSVSLEKVVKLEQGTLTAKDLEYKNQIGDLTTKIRELKGEKHDLEIANSHLKGQIAAPKAKTRAVKAKVIPEFEISNVVYGGPEGRPMSATIKPRAN